MKTIFTVLCGVFTCLTFGQNITVDSQTFTPQELIEDILIDSDCIDNVIVTNVVGGNFGGPEESFGYFDATGTTFPFQSGLVLSTGRLSNVPGPNTSISDDDAPGWTGDNDLETALNENNTLNATILEFDFTSVANEIRFRYIFASEEYQEGDSSTCQYSDLFGFLIRQVDESQYTNIALVPGTNTPVKVTTVHPEIPGACQAENEAYFGSFNGATAPINFNGQTEILTAIAQVIPNVTYHVKLVIADEQNYRYDSAVFLEAGSFQLSTDIGPDRLIANGNPICGTEPYTIVTNEPGASNSYRWFKNGSELIGETGSTLTVNDSGFYEVEVTKDSCLLFGEVTIEYIDNPNVVDAILVACDENFDGITTYDLFDAEPLVTNNDSALIVTDFFVSLSDAENYINPISGANSFLNSSPSQTIYAVVANQANCSSIAAIELQISNNVINIPPIQVCDDDDDGIAEFNLSLIESSISDQIPVGATVSVYQSEDDAFSGINVLNDTFQNTLPETQTLYVKVENNNQCYAISTVELVVLPKPRLLEDETIIYCLNNFPATITLDSGVIGGNPIGYSYEWTFNGSTIDFTTALIETNDVGIYTAIVTNAQGCSSIRTLTVLASNSATIDDVFVSEGTNNNSISISVSGEGDYEFALDRPYGPFQDNPNFSTVSAGFHTVYVNDKNGCGIIEKTVSVLGFPKFFTPNGDSYKDRWQVKGINSDLNQAATVKIFNRYGKLISEFSTDSQGWDGTLNGQPLPSNDYWFIVSFTDGRTFTGHFALKR